MLWLLRENYDKSNTPACQCWLREFGPFQSVIYIYLYDVRFMLELAVKYCFCSVCDNLFGFS